MRSKAIARKVLEILIPTLLYRYDILRHRNSEQELAILSKLCKKGAISIDIGANIGLYSYYMLPYSSAVIAFEPLPQMHKRLAKLFKSKNIQIHAIALSDRKGECEIRLPRGNPAWATIDFNNTLALAGDMELETYKIPMCRLDDYQFQNIGLIKIDVEGHEEAVLHGASETIVHCKPNLLIEIEERHNQGAIARVIAFLSGLGYKGYFLDAGKMNSIDGFDPKRDQPLRNVGISGKLGRYINNFIFLPDGAYTLSEIG